MVKRILTVGLVVVVGAVVLAGYFFSAQLNRTVAFAINWSLILISAAGLIGAGYLLASHVRKILRREKGALLSVIVVVSFILTLVCGLIFRSRLNDYDAFLLNVMIPVHTSMLAILAVTLFIASLRIIRLRGWTPMSISFLISAILSLALELGLLRAGQDSIAAKLLTLVDRIPSAGVRGILIGMALGGLLMGLRLLFHLDRQVED